MANVVFIVMDMNDGVPLWVFYSKDEAERYQIGSRDYHPETEIVECDIG